MNQPEIEFEHVVKRFGQTTVIPDLSFTINKGEFVTVLGSSGSGKTTTLKMINGLWQPTSGTVKIGGKELTEHNQVDLRRHVGYVVQQIALFPHLTIKQNIAVVPKLLGWEQAKIDQRVDELLDLVKLPSDQYADRYPAQLSGGQQQRISICRALAMDPAYILFDEPTSALDPELEAQVLRVLQQLANDGDSLIVVTHNMEFARRVADKIVFVEDGRVDFTGSADDFFNHPTPRIKEFLAAMEF